MSKRKRESFGKKALAALMFAGGLLALPQPALSEKVAVSDATIQKITEASITPEGRAYHLLRFSRSVLADENATKLKENFHYANEPRYFFRESNVLANWADELVMQKLPVRGKNANPSKNAAVAEHAMKEALALLQKSSKNSIKLHLYFIASLLANRAGFNEIASECNKWVAKTIDDCEKVSPVDPETVKAAVSVLNSMAYAIVPLRVPDQQLPIGTKPMATNADANNPSAANYTEAEKLKLRAVAIADRLPADNHVRRKAHRDMVLWYTQLGRTQFAERQKKILFELVGISDDRILYPVSGFCGGLSWWALNNERSTAGLACGRG